MKLNRFISRVQCILFFQVAALIGLVRIQANPLGGTVTSGKATFSPPGSAQFTINQSSPTAFITWQNFNINPGETTTFVQPSSSSVAWNQINDVNPSQILGNLNANGYVVLQNSSGFYVGGQAAITAHNLILTTAAATPPDLSTGGPWSFNAPPPTAKIINYGQIKTTGGGSVFLIASDIENRTGTDNQNNNSTGNISAPGGKIGLYAGQTVLVSMSPDGRGLSAEVTLPTGSVDNHGNLIADAGSIVAQAKIVNQGGLVQANSVKNVNGVIELVASDTLNLDAGSTISARGDIAGTSSGGSLTLDSANTFADAAGSTITITGGAQGGNGGQVNLSAPAMSSLNSVINGRASAGYLDGGLAINTANDILLKSDGNPVAGQFALNVNSWSSGFSQITLQSAGDIELSSLWKFTDKSGVPGSLSLLAGNTLSLDNGAGIRWSAANFELTAKTINQDAILQADSAAYLNGIIKILASDSLSIGAGSLISAQGDSTSANPSPGGFVVMKSGNAYADTSTSTINVAGQAGGQDGIAEILFPSAATVQSSIGKYFAFLINPLNLTLSGDATDTSSSNPNFNIGDLFSYTKIAFFANQDITVNTYWQIADSPDPVSSLSLQAARNVILTDGSAMQAGKNWAVNLRAGTELASAASRTSGYDGIYLDGGAIVETQNGDINLWAGNEIQVGWTGSSPAIGANSGTGSITTKAGGNILAQAVYGDINTGGNQVGYAFQDFAPYYIPDPYLGGISTAAGGNVELNAGGDITSYLPSNNDPNNAIYDGGSGAFGPEKGNVIINALGNVYGHYVLANGTGMVTAQNGNVGTSDYLHQSVDDFALSLVKGDWSVNAPHGSIYLQEVRNPNGVFNNADQSPDSNPGYYVFNYDSAASVSLNAANAVEITGANLPRTSDPVPMVFPPLLDIVAGLGGFQLDLNLTLFQSADAGLNINTTGNLLGIQNGVNPQIYMSDSGNPQWDQTLNTLRLGGLHTATPLAVNSPDPVLINVSGNIQNLDLYTIKETRITVGGNMINSSYAGENLHPTDTSFVNVHGQIYYAPFYTFTALTQPIQPINPPDNPSGYPTWYDIFYLLVDPTVAAGLVVPYDSTLADLKNYREYFTSLAGQQYPNQPFYYFPASSSVAANPGFSYNSTTLKLGFGGVMSAKVSAELQGPLDVISIGKNGLPVIQNGHLVLDPVSFVPASAIQSLYNESQTSSKFTAIGLQIGGPGQFDVNAGSVELGNSQGIESWGIVGPQLSGLTIDPAYASLATVTPLDGGAGLDVTVAGDLGILTSRIASMFGGMVNVSAGGSMNLGSQEIPEGTRATAFGVYTTGHSDVNVTAQGDIFVNASRIAAYNGGSVNVVSKGGSVNVGSGGNTYVDVPLVTVTPLHGSVKIGPGAYFVIYPIYGSGIVTTSLPLNYQTPGGNGYPGDITIFTPQGNISSIQAGVLQLALDGDVAGGPKVSLTAGTTGIPPTPDSGNIDLGDGGVIGGTVNLSATGNIKGAIVSRQNSTIAAGENFSGTVLSGGTANLSAGGTASGTIVGIGGISASAGSLNATLLSQNVSVGGAAATSTLGTSATASSASQSASQQASATTQQAVAATDNSDDDSKKKKSVLSRRVGRVTVLLSSATPGK